MKALILNYGVGNVFSVSSALRRAGFTVELGMEPLRDYDLIVFPGVGSFNAVAKYLSRYHSILNELRTSNTYFLGICIGMHVMFEYGFEGGLNEGLKWFNGYVDRIKANVKLPHVGWDRVYATISDGLTEVIDNQYVYFMHSYVAYTSDSVSAYCNYGVEFPATIVKDNLVGVQFHPEKSGRVGMKFLDRLRWWLRC